MNSRASSDKPEHVTILIKGRLGPCWSDWFDGLTVTPAGADRNNTVLSGPVTDQAALHGILNQIGSLGLTLLSVDCQYSPVELPDAERR